MTSWRNLTREYYEELALNAERAGLTVKNHHGPYGIGFTVYAPEPEEESVDEYTEDYHKGWMEGRRVGLKIHKPKVLARAEANKLARNLLWDSRSKHDHARFSQILEQHGLIQIRDPEQDPLEKAKRYLDIALEQMQFRSEGFVKGVSDARELLDQVKPPEQDKADALAELLKDNEVSGE